MPVWMFIGIVVLIIQSILGGIYSTVVYKVEVPLN